MRLQRRSDREGSEISRESYEFLLDNFMFKSLTFLILFFLIFPIFFIAVVYPDKIGNLITGMASYSSLEVDSEPRITINDSVFYVNQFINLTPCGYDLRGGNLTCTFSQPFDYNLGTWTPTWSDIGIYEVQINATNDWGEFSTKNVTIMISSSTLEGGCELFFTVEEDHKLTITWNSTLPINDFEYAEYTDFTLSYVDYLVNATFNETDAVNITNINENFYFDNTANETKERYYRLYGHHDGRTFICNQTFGKITRELTMNYGRWNYISSPFKRTDKSLSTFLTEAESDLEVAFKYNHDSGGFNFYLFDVNFGNIQDVEYSECLILQPTEKTLVTTAGKIMTDISANLTINFDRWNYLGWIIDRTDISAAFSGYEDDLEVLFIYDHENGGFKFRLFDLGFGTISEISPTDCNIIQPFNAFLYEYEMT